MRYRSKPTVIEAVQWTGDNWREVFDFVGDPELIASTIDTVDHLPLQLKAGKNGESGWLPVPVGNWIARNADDRSDYWPVEPAHMERKYEPDVGGDTFFIGGGDDGTIALVFRDCPECGQAIACKLDGDHPTGCEAHS